MGSPPDTLAQAPVEDVDWDRFVLGPYFEVYRRLLASGDEAPKPQARAEEFFARGFLVAGMPETQTALPSLAQVLLANALTGVSAPAVPNAEVQAAPSRAPQVSASRRRDLRQVNPLLAAALDRYCGDMQMALPWIGNEPGRARSALGSLYLAKLTAQFDDSVSVLLHYAGATGRLMPVRRQLLNALLFHPLQNADQHGRHPWREQTFSGVAARIVDGLQPQTPSFTAYRATLGERFADGRGAFLEVIVHDNGVGIASHFYEAKRNPTDPNLFSLHPFHEWETLLNAFERHQTSKPGSFRRATTGADVRPGVGLVGLLSALKQLRAYLELRTGRLRVYQWYRDEDVIPDSQLLKPRGLPVAGLRVPGTIFRLLVPLDAPPVVPLVGDGSGVKAGV